MAVEWVYGITTCSQRICTLLPRTLASLAVAGFDRPRVFVSGLGYQTDLPTTQRSVTHAEGFFNWITAAWELFIRNPMADRYAIFEDDIVLCRNVRQYLDAQEQTYPRSGYLNLFTFASNDITISNKPNGWHRSDQLGKGAVALVFSNQVMRLLLQQFLTYFPQVDEAKLKPFNNTDGAIQHALVRMARCSEYVHRPSLVQHVGEKTTLPGNQQHPQAKTFPGESFDAMSLLT